MKYYELLFILPGTLAENEVSPTVNKIKTLIEEIGGKEVKIDEMGKNRLAYPMKHIRYGYFQICYFQAEPAVADIAKDRLKLLDELLRFMIQSYDPKKQVTSKITYYNLIDRTPEAVVPMPSTIKKEEVLIKEEKAPITEVLPAVEIAIDTVPKAKETKEKTPAVANKKVTMEEIDKELDKILGGDITDV